MTIRVTIEKSAIEVIAYQGERMEILPANTDSDHVRYIYNQGGDLYLFERGVDEPREGVFEIYRSLFRKNWRWRYRAANGRIIFAATEGYYNFHDMLMSIPTLKTIAFSKREQLD